MLLNTYNHHYAETYFIFSIFMVMSRPRSIYVVSMLSIFLFSASFSLSLIIKSHLNRSTFFFVYYLVHLLLDLHDNVVEESE